MIWYCPKCKKAGYLGAESQLTAMAEAIRAHEEEIPNCKGNVVVARLGKDAIPDWVLGELTIG